MCVYNVKNYYRDGEHFLNIFKSEYGYTVEDSITCEYLDFPTFAKCLNYIKTELSEAAVEIIKENQELIESGTQAISISREYSEYCAQYTKNLPEELKALKKRYSHYYNFEYIAESGYEHSERYDVVKYSAGVKNAAFHIDKIPTGTDPDIKISSGKERLLFIQNNFRILKEIVYKNVDYVHAQIAVICLQLEAIDNGEYILGRTADNYRSYKEKLKKKNYEKYEIINDAFSDSFVDQSMVFHYSTVTLENLSRVYYHDEVSSELSDLLSGINSYILTKLGKTTQSVIVENNLTRYDFLKYTAAGCKVFKSEDVIRFLKNNNNRFAKSNIKVRPKYDFEKRNQIRDYLEKNRAVINIENDLRIIRDEIFRAEPIEKRILSIYQYLNMKSERPETKYFYFWSLMERSFIPAGLYPEAVNLCRLYIDYKPERNKTNNGIIPISTYEKCKMLASADREIDKAKPFEIELPNAFVYDKNAIQIMLKK